MRTDCLCCVLIHLCIERPHGGRDGCDGGIHRIDRCPLPVESRGARTHRRAFARVCVSRSPRHVDLLEGESVLYREPRMAVLTGLVVGVVAIGLYVLQFENNWLPNDELVLRSDDERSELTGPTVAMGRVERSGDNALTNPWAAHNNSRRSDAARARATAPARADTPPDATFASTEPRNDPPLSVPQAPPRQQRPLQANNMRQPALRSARTSSHEAAKNSHPHASRERRLARREPARNAPGVARPTRLAANAATTSRGHHARPAGTRSKPSVPVHERSTTRAVKKTSPTTSARPHRRLAPASGPTASISGTAPAAPAASNGPAPSADASPQASDDGRKTRAQVLAELVRAREDGSLPAFGNPSPVGPGGTPSSAVARRP